MIRLEGKTSVPQGYIEAFKHAEKVFLHQRVFDPLDDQLVYLAAPESDESLCEEAEKYIGP